MSRSAEIHRETNETDVRATLALDGTGAAEVDTGVGFFDHMLCLMAKHGGFDLRVKARGDLQVDPHHSVEDVGIVLGQVLDRAVGMKEGITRYGLSYVPMDDALVRCAVDLCGRSFCEYKAPVPTERLGAFDTELVEDFVRAFSQNGRFTVHVDLIRGRNSHHIVEAIFKSLGRSLGQAASMSGRAGIPSTKGMLE